MEMQNIELGLSIDSVHEWTVEDAVRDLIQNWLDNPNESLFEFNGDSLILINKDTTLDASALVIGCSSKRNNDSQRGRHGDGLKSAMACLIREGIELTIYNGSTVWKPFSGYSNTFEQDVVIIEQFDCGYEDHDLTIDIKGLSEEQIENIKLNTLAFNDDYPVCHTTSKGNILLDDKYKGRIYCGGLYVSSVPDLDHGYDFKQEYLTLDRDRKAVDSFDVKWQTKEMFAEHSSSSPSHHINETASLIYNGCHDTQFIHHSSIPSKLEEAVMDKYEETMDGAILANSADEARKLRASGFKKVEFLANDAFTTIVKRSSRYREISGNAKAINPIDLLDTWLETWEDDLTAEAVSDFNKMKYNVEQLTSQ